MNSYLGKLFTDFRFAHPAAVLVSGSTGSGKSFFVKNVIEKGGIRGRITSIYYFMPRLERLDINPPPGQRLYLMEGLPTRNWVDETFRETQRDSMIVIDDQWKEAVDNRCIEYLLVYGRRHLGITIFGITQNFYQRSKASTLIRYCFL